MTDIAPDARRMKRAYVRKKPLQPRVQAIQSETVDLDPPQPIARETRASGRPEVIGRGPGGRLIVRGRDGEQLSRTRTGMEDIYHVPPGFEPDGYTYQWKALTVLNEDARAHQTALQANGWRSVPAERHDGYWTAPGTKGSVIVQGLMLMELPTVLVEEARADDKRNADAQLRNAKAEKLESNMTGGFISNDSALGNKMKVNIAPSGVARPAYEIAPD